jgi:hypothetical protein
VKQVAPQGTAPVGESARRFGFAPRPQEPDLACIVEIGEAITVAALRAPASGRVERALGVTRTARRRPAPRHLAIPATW